MRKCLFLRQLKVDARREGRGVSEGGREGRGVSDGLRELRVFFRPAEVGQGNYGRRGGRGVSEGLRGGRDFF